MGKPLRVLIVEDLEDDALLVIRELERGGYDTTFERVETAEAMTAALEKQAWDIIIADYKMPHFSAPEALKLLQQSGLDLPFIIVSGTIGEETAVEAMKAGAHDYLMKDNLTRLAPAVERELYEAEVREKRKQAEEALRESKEKLQRMFEFATDGIVVTDLNGNIMELNEAAVRLHGSDSKEKLIGRSAFELIAEKDRVRAMETLKSALEDGQIRRDVELTFLTEDDREYLAEVSSALLRDAAGNPAGFISIFRDITERKQAEDALKFAYAELGQIFDATADAIRVIDKDFNILRINEAFATLSGVSKDEAVGKKCYDVSRCPRCHSPSCALTQILNGDERIEVEEERERGDGTRISCIVTVTPFRQPDGKVIGIVSTIKDITKRKRAEEHAQFLASVLESSSQPFAVGYSDGRLRTFNTAYCELLGYSRGELHELKWDTELTPPEWREVVAKAAEEIIRTQQPQRFEKEYIRKDGSLVPVEVFVNPIFDSKGDLEYFFSFFTDITKRKQAEEALKESEERYRHLFDNLNDAVFLADVETGMIIETNQQGATLLGRGHDEIVGMHQSELHPPGKADEYRQKFDTHVQKGRVADYDGEVIRKDGAIVPVRISAAPLTIHGQHLILGLFHDITERKRAEETLRESETKLKTILENTRDVVFHLSPLGKIQYVSPKVEEMYGYKPEDLIGKHLKKTTPVSELPKALKVLKSVLSGKVINNFGINQVDANGKIIPVEINATPVRKGGKIIAAQGVMRDITERKQAEETLRTSEEKYRQLAENTADAIWTVDMNMRPTYISFSITRLLGYSVEEAMAKTMEEVYTPTSFEVAMKAFAEELAIEKMEQKDLFRSRMLELELKRNDGSIVPVEVRFSFLRGADAQPVEILAIARDITERKEAEEALRGSEEKYRSLVSNVKLGVFRSTPDPAGRFLEVNPAMEKITGYRRKELLQMNVTDLYVHPEERERFLEEVASGKGKAAEEVQFKKKDGTEIVVLDRKVAVRDDAGNILYFDGILEDITERKQAEERIVHLTNVLGALRSINQLIAHEKDKGRLIQQSCNILVETRGYSIAWILLLDEDGNYISAAGSGAEKSFPILLEQMKRGEYPPCVREVLAQEPPFTACDDVKRQHIECVLTDCYMGGGVGFVNQLEYEGRVYGTVGVAVSPEMAQDEEEHELFRELTTDVSFALASIELEEEHKRTGEKLREAEAFKELDRLRSELMANISHELRTPLASIKGFATTLLQPDVKWSEEEQRDFLQSIDQEADRLTRLISDLLDMSRLEAGALKLEKGDYRISEILGSVGYKLASLTERHQLEVIAPAELPAVFVDEMRIGQVITNLVENATKFSSKDSPITIEAQLAGDQVIISVTDRGQGIAPELLDRVFDRFYQTQSIVTGRKSGTGLGLSICQGIIKAHGGRIWVESKAGEGSKFSLNLPVSQSEGQDG